MKRAPGRAVTERSGSVSRRQARPGRSGGANRERVPEAARVRLVLVSWRAKRARAQESLLSWWNERARHGERSTDPQAPWFERAKLSRHHERRAAPFERQCNEERSAVRASSACRGLSTCLTSRSHRNHRLHRSLTTRTTLIVPEHSKKIARDEGLDSLVTGAVPLPPGLSRSGRCPSRARWRRCRREWRGRPSARR